jgi:hypothetical protein
MLALSILLLASADEPLIHYDIDITQAGEQNPAIL